MNQRGFNICSVEAKDKDVYGFAGFVNRLNQGRHAIARLNQKFHLPSMEQLQHQPILARRLLNICSGPAGEAQRRNRMPLKRQGLRLLAGIAFLSLPLAGGDPAKGKSRRGSTENAQSASAILWREPTDIRSRNLFYGPGGEKHQPEGPFTFVEEDLNGTNPKYVVRDVHKIKWTVKLGMEARPETVATRLVWAPGYFAS